MCHKVISSQQVFDTKAADLIREPGARDKHFTLRQEALGQHLRREGVPIPLLSLAPQLSSHR